MASTSYHVRSISLPCRSHPAIIRVKEELSKLKTLETPCCQTSEAICNSLSGLAELYDCTNDLLGLKLTKQSALMDCLLDGSVRLLDICGGTRDIVSQIKEHTRDLESSIRRRKGDISIESSVVKFNSFRRRMKKEAKRLIASLKQIKKQYEALAMLDSDQKHSSVIGLLTEVTLSSISVYQSLLMFVTVPVSKTKGRRWSAITKLIHTERVSCEEENMNELERIDAALISLCRSRKGEKIESAQRGLVALETHFEGIESNLECLFRRLIKTRTLFLNMASD
ncbi:hypothetical protein DCAR_0831874 [Daucus carota subsp. sativus]|uniref:DUF241 domain protein n=1 Tax=Daucus carota subsp. sativus TaxID=79200 RepID=A0A175YNA9_DAUCS|nr:PREDICTED: uncharacterized protein LOC108199131 [Daucus carota subsp. sativus]WOH12371.1 hypothetical protein DCAR_0831874 [Daucus carota subsp. sativus]